MFKEIENVDLATMISEMRPGDHFDFVSSYDRDHINDVGNHSQTFGVKCIHEFDLDIALVAMYGIGMECAVNVSMCEQDTALTTLLDYFDDVDIDDVLIECDDETSIW